MNLKETVGTANHANHANRKLTGAAASVTQRVSRWIEDSVSPFAYFAYFAVSTPGFRMQTIPRALTGRAAVDSCKEQRPRAQRCWQAGGRGLLERARQTPAATPEVGRTPTRTFQTSPRNWLLLPALIAGLGLILAGRVTAQIFTTLHSFTALNNSTNSDGAYPQGLIWSSNTLYGTTAGGGDSEGGTVFKLNTDGTGFTNLHTFTFSNGAFPVAGLISSENTLYGTMNGGGGGSGVGPVFAINVDGTGFTNLYDSTVGNDAYKPNAGLILSGSTLYGTAFEGGSLGKGTVFAVNTGGTGFTNLHSFTAATDNGNGFYTNSDGAYPQAGLVLSGNTLYGTAEGGGSSGIGTVFAVNTDGTGFKNLHNFSVARINSSGVDTNSDGAYPQAKLIFSGNTLYGTAGGGGSSGAGTVFAINISGSGFTNLYSFTAWSTNPSNLGSNSDGAFPLAGLVLSSSTLYGMAREGGSSGKGTVFAVKTDGTGFTTLYSFTARDPATGTNSDGANPQAGLILTNNTLYGTAEIGGSSGKGTVFSLTLPPPQLTIIRSAASVILTWPTNAAGFTLESTTNLGSSAAWSTASPAPVVVNGQNTVTNPISGIRKFYRLINP